MRILGVDPGSGYTGYGIVETQGNRLIPIHQGRISLKKLSSLPEKLKMIFEELCGIIQEYRPEETAIEKTFYSVNAQSVIVLSHARASAMLACAMKNLPIFEYSPNQIKSSTVGAGKADKDQVSKMISILLGIRKTLNPDESDALAVAVCHFNLRKISDLSASKKVGTRLR